jgi:hypothetical protein
MNMTLIELLASFLQHKIGVDELRGEIDELYKVGPPPELPSAQAEKSFRDFYWNLDLAADDEKTWLKGLVGRYLRWRALSSGDCVFGPGEMREQAKVLYHLLLAESANNEDSVP